MSLNEKIFESINTELPAMVAGELKNFIAAAESDKSALDSLRREHQLVKDTLAKYENEKQQDNNIKNREAAVFVREQAMTLAEAVFKVKVEHVDQRVNEIRGLVQTVFQSNRLDYSMNLNIPYKDQYGNTGSSPAYGNITKTP